MPSRGEEGEDVIGERKKLREEEEPIGERSFGEEHRDCTGERERGPGAKLPEAAGCTKGITAATGDGALDGPRETLGEEAHAERVFASRLCWGPVVVSWAFDNCVSTCSTGGSGSASLSCDFQLKPRPKEVTPQLFPTLAAR